MDTKEASGTPRPGTLSGGALALDVGLISLHSAAAQRGQIGSGGTVDIRLSFAFWDQWLLGIMGGGLLPSDHAPFEQRVVDCQTVNGTQVGCDDMARNQKSTVSNGFLGLETGYQHRFRPWRTSSLLPKVIVGYAQRLSKLSRGVNCDGCKSIPIEDVNTSGVFLAPAFAVTFGATGELAVGVRSEWYLIGDLAQRTMLDFELGLP